MSNIPPLVCDTPPPIDFGEAASSNYDDFGEFETADHHFDDSSPQITPRKKQSANNFDLPIPDDLEIPIDDHNIPEFFIPEDTKYHKTLDSPPVDDVEEETTTTTKAFINNNNLNENDKISKLETEIGEICTAATEENLNKLEIDEPKLANEKIDNYSETDVVISDANSQINNLDKNDEGINYRSDSPPSLVLSAGDASFCIDDDDDDEDDINDAFENTDNSLPSLKLESVTTDSKSLSSPDLSVDEKPQHILVDQGVESNLNENVEIEKKIAVEFIQNTIDDSFDDFIQSDNLEINEKVDNLTENIETKTEDSKTQEDNFDKFVAHSDESQSDKLEMPSNEVENVEVCPTVENIPLSIVTQSIDDSFDDFVEFENSNSPEIAEKPSIEETPSTKSTENIEFPKTHSIDDSFDDFVEFPINNNARKLSKKDIEQSEKELDLKFSANFDSDENQFAADFSQFNETVTESEKPSINNDDDFDDFTTFSDAVVPERDELVFDDEEEDDDFGEFSDFSQAQSEIPATILNLENLSAKIAPLLDVMFPNVVESEAVAVAERNLMNATTTRIQDFENSKALEHQWQHSVGKKSLVKALGIDSRNILYGGSKWNSSMPRYASNLGFSPLEPLKPDAQVLTPMMLTPTKEFSSSTAAASSIPGATATKPTEIPAAQFDWNSSGLVNPLDASHAHTLLLDLEQLVVVANLDKIKLNSSTCIASASSTLSTASIVSCSSSTITTNNNNNQLNHVTTVPTYYNMMMLTNTDDFADGTHFYSDASINSIASYSSGGDGDGVTNPFTHLAQTNAFDNNNINTNNDTKTSTTNQFGGLFDQYLNIRVQEILHKTNAAQDQPSRIEFDWNTTSAATESSAATIITSETSFETTEATTTSNVQLDSNKHSSIFVEGGQRDDDDEDDDGQPKPISSSYVMPGSGNLKETHIYTPCKVQPQRDVATIQETNNPEPTPVPSHQTVCPDFDYEKAALGIVINENVVKKEYRDVEYNPDKISGTSFSSDDFSDFQSMSVSAVPPPPQQSGNIDAPINIEINNILQPTKSNDTGIVINWPDPGNVVDLSELEEFDSYSNETVQKIEPVDNNQLRLSNFKDIYAGGKIKLNDFSKPVIGISPTENMFESASQNDEDDFSDFQSVEPIQKQIPDVIPPPLTINSQVPKNPSLPPQMLQPNSMTSSQSSANPLNSHSGQSNVPLQPSVVLMPEALNSQPKLESSIKWPEPGIDPDEMARLESIFPAPAAAVQKPKPIAQKSEDDEWTDFVGVTNSPIHKIQPITHIISQNIIKHQNDDDDWSDFVSSTTAPALPQYTLNQAPPQWNSGPNFPSWNAPPQFSSWQNPTNLYQPPPTPQQYVPTISMNTATTTIVNNNLNHHNGFHHQSQQQQPPPSSMYNSSNGGLKSTAAPSISVIPDLGFVAPKTLMNIRSKSNFPKK